MEYRLLEKKELWISPVRLNHADLGACARAVGEVLGLGDAEIMVTDAQENRLTLDILVPTVQADQIVAREKPLLKALAAVPGVEVTLDTRVHSQGILGLISLDEEAGRELLERSSAMLKEISRRIARRAIVVATGPEVLNGQIKDTNTPFLLQALGAAGYEAVKGPVIEDKEAQILTVFSPRCRKWLWTRGDHWWGRRRRKRPDPGSLNPSGSHGRYSLRAQIS